MTQLTTDELKLLAELLSMANVQVGKAKEVIALLDKLQAMTVESVDTEKKDS